MSDAPLYTEAGAIAAGLFAIALAIVKSCGSKGLYCRTPCGSDNFCLIDLNDGRPTVDGTNMSENLSIDLEMGGAPIEQTMTPSRKKHKHATKHKKHEHS